MRRPVLLFISAILLGGLGGMFGSMAGHALAKSGLYVGGIIGGLIGVIVAAHLAAAANWIDRSRRTSAAIGGAVGFILAALIAGNTISSPVGPIASTLLVGIGAVLGARAARGSDIGERNGV